MKQGAKEKKLNNQKLRETEAITTVCFQMSMYTIVVIPNCKYQCIRCGRDGSALPSLTMPGQISHQKKLDLMKDKIEWKCHSVSTNTKFVFQRCTGTTETKNAISMEHNYVCVCVWYALAHCIVLVVITVAQTFRKTKLICEHAVCMNERPPTISGG